MKLTGILLALSITEEEDISGLVEIAGYEKVKGKRMVKKESYAYCEYVDVEKIELEGKLRLMINIATDDLRLYRKTIDEIFSDFKQAGITIE